VIRTFLSEPTVEVEERPGDQARWSLFLSPYVSSVAGYSAQPLYVHWSVSPSYLRTL
jgi:hypothetical protein